MAHQEDLTPMEEIVQFLSNQIRDALTKTEFNAWMYSGHLAVIPHAPFSVLGEIMQVSNRLVEIYYPKAYISFDTSSDVSTAFQDTSFSTNECLLCHAPVRLNFPLCYTHSKLKYRMTFLHRMYHSVISERIPKDIDMYYEPIRALLFWNILTLKRKIHTTVLMDHPNNTMQQDETMEVVM